ncbi:unnamed protein product [Prunus armeniaca]
MSAGSDTAGNCRKTAGFYPDFPELVPAIPATKSCDQGEIPATSGQILGYAQEQKWLRIGFYIEDRKLGRRFGVFRPPKITQGTHALPARVAARGLGKWTGLRIRRIVKRSPGYSGNANPGFYLPKRVRMTIETGPDVMGIMGNYRIAICTTLCTSSDVDKPHTWPGASRRMRGDVTVRWLAQCEVARVFGLAGVLTDPVRGRVRPDV